LGSWRSREQVSCRNLYDKGEKNGQTKRGRKGRKKREKQRSVVIKIGTRHPMRRHTGREEKIQKC